MRFPRPQPVCSSILFALALSSIHSSALSRDASSDHALQPPNTVAIPGPLRSFLRMAGISQEVSPDDVLPTLARNLSLYGYDEGKEKEYLVLVNRYVHQARDIQRL